MNGIMLNFWTAMTAPPVLDTVWQLVAQFDFFYNILGWFGVENSWFVADQLSCLLPSAKMSHCIELVPYIQPHAFSETLDQSSHMLREHKK